MEYEKGDKVRIKSEDWYKQMLSIPNKLVWQNKLTNDFVGVWCGSHIFKESMFGFLGKTMTIQEVGIDFYLMEEDTCGYEFNDEMIEGFVEEEEIEFTEEDKYWCDIMSASDPTTYVLPQGYQFVDEHGNVINATKIVLEKKEKEYPKTYKECFNICFGNKHHIIQVVGLDGLGDNKELFESFIKLKVCRDAYWKLYGDEIGLGKPWKPDWEDENQEKYIIGSWLGTIQCLEENFVSHSLAFPTAEMRDAFYENFKEEIEFVKELL